MLRRWRKLRKIFATYGIDGVAFRMRWWLRERADRRAIADWFETHGHVLSDAERSDYRTQIGSFTHSPLISIVMPVYDVDERWLRRAIGSVIDQVYENWELCIADDASPSPHVRRVLDEFASNDARVKVVYRETNGHISAASNSALELATGEFTGLLDHDDELTEDALFHVVSAINADASAEIFYSDEDTLDENGGRHSPRLKPGWSRDLFYSVNYLTHFAVYRTSLLKRIGGFRLGFEGSQDYELALRAVEEAGDDAIRHIPHILYHWRAIRGSVALSLDEKPYAHERARNAIREHFARTGVDARVEGTDFHLHRVVYEVESNSIPTSVISVDPARGDEVAAALNREAKNSQDEVLIFKDSDLSWRDEQQTSELAAAAMQAGIGAVGCRIVGPGGVTEQAGIVLDAELSPSFAFHGVPREVPGNLFRNIMIANAIATSASCLAIRRDLFEEMDGFDDEVFPSGLFDIDLCLRLREAGKRIVLLPHIELLRRTGRSRLSDASDLERQVFRDRWGKYVARDPFVNPALKRDGSFEIDG